MKLNQKGFSLIEMLAVVVIIGLLLVFIVPNVSKLIEQNKNDAYEKLKDSIITATKNYISDNRYKIEIAGKCTGDEMKAITKIGQGKENEEENEEKNKITDSKIQLSRLTEGGYIKEPVKNPKTNKEINLENSYIKVEYNCKTKDYEYTLEDLKEKKET